MCKSCHVTGQELFHFCTFPLFHIPMRPRAAISFQRSICQLFDAFGDRFMRPREQSGKGKKVKREKVKKLKSFLARETTISFSLFPFYTFSLFGGEPRPRVDGEEF